jgi:VanZ family protein
MTILFHKPLRDFLGRWFPLIVWLCFIFFMSTGTFSADNTSLIIGPVLHFLFPGLPPDQIETIHGIIRKGAHVFEYFVLGLLFFRVFGAGKRGAWKWQWSLLAVAGVAAWALGDELHQSFVMTRTASLRDVAIDTTGGLVAQFVGAFWNLRPPKQAARQAR